VPRTYTYVIVSDGGGAPCYEKGLLTLALCKPAIRRTARLGDLVLAYNSKKLGDSNRVPWAGVVKEKLSFADYWNDKRFKGRGDNIYRPVEGAPPEPVAGAFEHPGGALHPEESHWKRDLGGLWVLAFEPWWYFGAAGPLAREGLRMGRGYIGHRVFEGGEAGWIEEASQTTPLPTPPVMPRAALSNCGSAPRPRRQPRKGVCVPTPTKGC